MGLDITTRGALRALYAYSITSPPTGRARPEFFLALGAVFADPIFNRGAVCYLPLFSPASVTWCAFSSSSCVGKRFWLTPKCFDGAPRGHVVTQRSLGALIGIGLGAVPACFTWGTDTISGLIARSGHIGPRRADSTGLAVGIEGFEASTRLEVGTGAAFTLAALRITFWKTVTSDEHTRAAQTARLAFSVIRPNTTARFSETTFAGPTLITLAVLLWCAWPGLELTFMTFCAWHALAVKAAMAAVPVIVCFTGTDRAILTNSIVLMFASSGLELTLLTCRACLTDGVLDGTFLAVLRGRVDFDPTNNNCSLLDGGVSWQHGDRS